MSVTRSVPVSASACPSPRRLLTLALLWVAACGGNGGGGDDRIDAPTADAPDAPTNVDARSCATTVPCIEPGPGSTSGTDVCGLADAVVYNHAYAGLTSGGQSTIDGRTVSSCIAFDFGSIVTPTAFRVDYKLVPSACGDTCGTACTFCNPPANTIFGRLRLFRSTTTNEASQYLFIRDLTTVTDQQVFNDVDPEGPLQWLLVCRDQCGADAFNVHLDDVYLIGL